MSDQIDDKMLSDWRINYGLDTRTPAEAMRWWHDNMDGKAPAGAVAALGLCIDELDRLRADAERYRWLRENLGKWRIEAYQTPVQSMVELHILGDSFFYNGDDLDRIIDGRRRDAAMGLTRPAEE